MARKRKRNRRSSDSDRSLGSSDAFVTTVRFRCQKDCCKPVRVFVPSRDFDVCWQTLCFPMTQGGASERLREGFLVHLLTLEHDHEPGLGCAWATLLSHAFFAGPRPFYAYAAKLVSFTGVIASFSDDSLFDFESYVHDWEDFVFDKPSASGVLVEPVEEDYLGVPMIHD